MDQLRSYITEGKPDLLGSLASRVMVVRVGLHQQNASSGVPSLRELARQRIELILAESDVEEKQELLRSLPPGMLEQMWSDLDNVSYLQFHTLRCMASSITGADYSGDVDLWIQNNENRLRKGDLFSNGRDCGLVRLPTGSSAVFPSSTSTPSTRSFARSNSLPGLHLISQKRPEHLAIQPSPEAFALKFDEMTHSLLHGLEWSNIFVAGGIVLGVLQSVDPPDPNFDWKSSDIDLYIYGLGPHAANDKIQHIFETVIHNLPKGTPYKIVRNSRTITLFSRYPLRRVQVVLKLVESPRAVLLNFDLDICAMGWDGKDVWMLPRAARALETGFNIFTTSLIHGHYLSTRKATHEDRLFKYAARGYGLRILPSYIDHLKAHEVDIAGLQSAASAWTARKIDFWRSLEPREAEKGTSVPPCDPRAPLVVRRDMCCRHTTERWAEDLGCLTSFSELTRHIALWDAECAGIVVSEPPSTWANGGYEVQNILSTYDDIPLYPWGESFDLASFVKSLDVANELEREMWERNVVDNFDETDGFLERDRPTRHRDNDEDENDEEYEDEDKDGNRSESEFDEDLCVENIVVEHRSTIQRTSYAESVSTLLGAAQDICIPLFLPKDLIAYVNTVVVDSLKETGIDVDPPLTCMARHRTHVRGFRFRDETDVDLVMWRFDSTTMWQLMDRRVDEVFEVLWWLKRVNAAVALNIYHRRALFRDLVARRFFHTPQPSQPQPLAMMTSQLDSQQTQLDMEMELEAFERWVTKPPPAEYKVVPSIRRCPERRAPHPSRLEIS